MHNQKNYEILFQEKPEPEKKVGMLFVYIVLGISLCVFVPVYGFHRMPKEFFLIVNQTLKGNKRKYKMKSVNWN